MIVLNWVNLKMIATWHVIFSFNLFFVFTWNFLFDLAPSSEVSSLTQRPSSTTMRDTYDVEAVGILLGCESHSGRCISEMKRLNTFVIVRETPWTRCEKKQRVGYVDINRCTKQQQVKPTVGEGFGRAIAWSWTEYDEKIKDILPPQRITGATKKQCSRTLIL